MWPISTQKLAMLFCMCWKCWGKHKFSDRKHASNPSMLLHTTTHTTLWYRHSTKGKFANLYSECWLHRNEKCHIKFSLGQLTTEWTTFWINTKKKHNLQYFRLSPWCSRGLQPFGMLCSINRQFVTREHVSPIFKVQDALAFLDNCTVQYP